MNSTRAVIDIIQSATGISVSINSYRVAGPKPWGGGKVIRTFKTTERLILESLRQQVPKEGKR